MPLFLRAGALSLALSAPVSPATLLGTMNSGMPPERFRGNSTAVVVFTDRAGIGAACGVAPEHYVIIACTRRTADDVPVIFMPNACGLGDKEYYAKIMCHEAGHVNGWSGNHEE